MRRRLIAIVVVSALAFVGTFSLRASEKPAGKLSAVEREALARAYGYCVRQSFRI